VLSNKEQKQAPARMSSAKAQFKNPRAKYNFQGRTCSIAGVGSYVPQRVLTNTDLEKMVSTSDEWITTRTGIKERHMAAKDEFTSDLGARAAEKAMRRAGVRPEEIDLIVVATITPDMPFPSTAALIQQKLGAWRAAAFDLEAACAGFIYGLEVAQQFIMSRTYDTVLVIGAEKLSSIVDWQDRNTCVLFGDGAGAAVLRNRPDSHGLLTAVMGADGRKSDLLFMAGGGSRCPATAESVAGRMHFLRMEGKETFKCAVQAMQTAAEEALRRCELDISRIKLIIPHQANRRIIDAVGERLGAKPEQMFVNLHKYGNTSAASVAIALDEAVQDGQVKPGDLLLLVVFGAGLTWGAAVIEW
jgi:3-oxoacyl-[acyl-carrier-protein] synthase-3